MVKKSHKKTNRPTSSKYQTFKLHGDFPPHKLLIYSVLDMLFGAVLGYMLQPYIASLLTSYAASAAY